jgi:hypothetical protein
MALKIKLFLNILAFLCVFLSLSSFFSASYAYSPTKSSYPLDEQAAKLKKIAWVNQLLSRTKRSLSTDFLISEPSLFSQRPCPTNCTCNYDTINCNDLIEKCDECSHWSQIDFNQIVQMRPSSFKHFKLSSNSTTHIIIYKLLNSSIGADTFKQLVIPDSSHVEITFQYNSLIKFQRNALNGLELRKNSTLIFNFPYTTQVVFYSNCFDGVQMSDQNVKLIVRVFKSFSVRFVGDFSLYKYLKQNSDVTSLNKFTNTSNNQKNNDKQSSISTGQFIIDIKSTHMVKFEENAFAFMRLVANARFYLDLELIEKLMVQRFAFGHASLSQNSMFIFYSKQVTFIDFRAYSFANINLMGNSKFQIYLEELASSICVQRNVFSNLRLHHSESYFNFSIINSKNVQFMHNSFSNVTFENRQAKVYIGIFNMPSLLLLFQNNNFYKQFLIQRLNYLWPQQSPNQNHFGHYDQNFFSFQQHQQQHQVQQQPMFSSNTDYFYNHLNINNGLNAMGLSNRIVQDNEYFPNKFDVFNFYLRNKQSYSYNVSFEKNCFSNLNFSYTKSSEARNFFIAVDNINTLLIDNFIFNYNNSKQRVGSTLSMNNLNLVLNVKHVVFSENSLQYIKNVRIEFLTDPRVLKLGLAAQSLDQSELVGQRVIRLAGLTNANRLRHDGHQQQQQLSNEYEEFDEHNHQEKSLVDRNLKLQFKTFNHQRRSFMNTYTFIDNMCNLTSIEKQDAVINMEFRVDSSMEVCSCQIIYLFYNQIKHFRALSELLSSNILPCKLNELSLISNCVNQLVCHSKQTQSGIKINQNYLSDYVKFWEFCISEVEPSIKNTNSNVLSFKNEQQESVNQLDTGYFYNNFYDVDGLFSGSVASSSYFDDNVDSSSLSDFPSLSSPSHSSTNMASAKLGKIIGIVIICFICGIILFMIAINIIQYKFRNDLLDDLECSSSNINHNSSSNNNNNNNQMSNDKNCSNHSLTNTTNSDQNNEPKNTNLISNCDELNEDCHGKLLKTRIEKQNRKNISNNTVDNQSVLSQGYVEQEFDEEEQYELDDDFYQSYCKRDEEDDDQDDHEIEYSFHSKRDKQFTRENVLLMNQFKSSKKKISREALNEDDYENEDEFVGISKDKVTSDSGNSSTYSDDPVQTCEVKKSVEPGRFNKKINKKSIVI